jgi:protocatechuate 3,4-dioxygenase beta subunit
MMAALAIALTKSTRSQTLLLALLAVCLFAFSISAQDDPSGQATQITMASATAQESQPSADAAVQPNGQPNSAASISGTVTSSATGEPIPKVRIILSPDQGNKQSYGAITDAGGNFSIDNIAPGRYDLSAEHRGYVSQRYHQENADTPGAMRTLAAGQSVNHLVFRLQQTAVIDGHVSDEDGDPLQGASVQILRRDYVNGKRTLTTAGQAMTDDRGEYRIFDIEPGHYYVMASWGQDRMFGGPGVQGVPNYAPVFYPNADAADHAAPMVLKPGDEIPGVDFQLMPSDSRGYEVSGKAVNPAAGKAYSNIFVTLAGENPQTEFMPNSTRRVVVNASDGTFSFPNVTPGDYVVSAMAIGPGTNPPESASQAVTVVDSDVQGLSLSVTPGISIAGQLSFEGNAGSPAGATVALQPQDELGLPGRQALVQADGTFTLTGVPDGIYSLNVWSRCGACFVKAVSSRGVDLFGKPITVQGGVGPSPLEITYSSNTAEVSGTVSTVDNQPAIGALIAVVPATDAPNRESRYRTATTDQYGRFDVTGIPPGEYSVIALKGLTPDDSFLDPDFMQPLADKAQSVQLTEGDHETVQLNLVTVDADSQ